MCAICGRRVQSDASKLFRHCKSWHKHPETKEINNKGFLEYGKLPIESKCRTFSAFLELVAKEAEQQPKEAWQ